MKLTLPNDPVVSDCAPSGVIETPKDPKSYSEYLLVCEARSTTLTDGYWRFVLENADGQLVLDVDDYEIGDLNRLTLLAVVRGLESIEGASSITLLSNNRYLIRSLSDSLPRWRQNDFVWENFGRRVDVQHADLWRRIDRALHIHRVEACLLSTRLVSAGPKEDGLVRHRVDSPHVDAVTGSSVPSPKSDMAPADRLRRWLMAGNAGGAQPAGRRFSAADLLETA